MAEVKISELTSATTPLAGTETVPIVQGGVTKKVAVSNLGGSAAWGGITGTLSNQTDLNSALSGKQATLVSGTNIKTINGSSVLGSGNLTISATGSTSNTYIPFNNAGTLSNSVLQQVPFGGPLQALQATNVAIVSFDDGTGVAVANFAASGWGNGSIGAPSQGLFIGYDMYESAFSAGSAMMYTGTHTTISKWLKTTDENGNTYYIPLYL